MRAAVLQRDELAAARPVEHHRFFEDGEAEHAVLADRFGPRGAVPGVAQICAADELFLALDECGIVADLDVHGASSAGCANYWAAGPGGSSTACLCRLDRGPDARRRRR